MIDPKKYKYVGVLYPIPQNLNPRGSNGFWI